MTRRQEFVTVVVDGIRVGQFINEDVAKTWLKKCRPRPTDVMIVPSHTIPKAIPSSIVRDLDDDLIAETRHNDKYAAKTDTVGLPLDDAPIGDVIGAAVRESLATDKTDDNERPEEEVVL